MKAMVRKAQCDFQFAIIYEQRKTNKILIAGFTNLAQALEGMGDRISASIDSLSGLVSDLSESLFDIHERMGEMAESAMQHDSNLRESLSAIHSRMGEMAETAIEHNEDMRRTATESADRERKALELLEAVEREYRTIA
jgi:methyl-accepting chemotaxis protein